MIVDAVWRRNSAEGSVLFTPCDDSHIVVCVFFDSTGIGAALNTGREIPIPFAGRGSCHENVISVAAVDDIPLEFCSHVLCLCIAYGLGPGGEINCVGPRTVVPLSVGCDVDSSDLPSSST